jgi:hypothetical protein
MKDIEENLKHLEKKILDFEKAVKNKKIKPPKIQK